MQRNRRKEEEGREREEEEKEEDNPTSVLPRRKVSWIRTGTLVIRVKEGIDTRMTTTTTTTSDGGRSIDHEQRRAEGRRSPAGIGTRPGIFGREQRDAADRFSHHLSAAWVTHLQYLLLSFVGIEPIPT